MGVTALMSNKLILASRSSARAKLLDKVGLTYEIYPAAVDETAVKAALLAEKASPLDIADALADLKAARVSARHPGRLVIGADQVLSLGGQIFDKARDLDEARAQLSALRGKRHELLSAAVVYDDGRPVWRHVGRVTLTMRSFSDDFLENYLNENRKAIFESVGCYQIEESGVVLFEKINGDFFTVMGLPALELFAYLRLRGILPT